jgi:protein O-mannosyl-transferase
MPVANPTVRALAACSVTALLAGLVYLNALHNPFVYDDYHTVVANTSLQNPSNLRAIVLHDVTRPIVSVSYGIDRALWGAKPFGFHATNVLLHMLNVILLYRLVWRLVDDRQGRPEVVAFATSVLFAVHPMMTEAVGYISGRSEVVCGTFFLLGLTSGRRWMRGGGARWAMVTIVLWVAMLASKEIGAMFPFVLFCYDAIAVGGNAEDTRRRMLRVHLPLMAIALLGGVVRLAVLARIEHPGEVTLHWSYVLLDLDIVRRYLWLMLWPSGQTLFHEVAAVNSVFDPRALFAFAAIGLLAAFAWRMRRVEGLATFGILWFLILLVPSAALIAFGQGEPMAEHRVYLASCGLLLVACAGVVRLDAWLDGARARTRWLVLGALTLVPLSFSLETLLRNAVWADPVVLWRESVDLAPTHYRPRLLLGEALQDAGRHEEAVEEYKMALRLRPTDVTGYLKLGLCLADMGRFDEARQTFRQAIVVDPHNEPAHRALAFLDMVGPAK